MHIAHFIQRFPPALGGSEAYFARLSMSHAALGDEVAVWTTTALDLEAFWQSGKHELQPGTRIEQGLRVRRYAPSHWFARKILLKLLSHAPIGVARAMSLPCNPIALRMLLDVYRDESPCDAVHASAFPYGWILGCGLLLAKRKKASFLVTPFLHLGDPDRPNDPTMRAYTSKGLQLLLHPADRVFAQTPSEADAIRKMGVHADRVVLQGLGVDPDECTGGDRQRARRAWGVGDDEVVIGHLANQSREKGTVDLLRAAQRAWESGATFRVVLAGPQMPNFRRFWSSFPVRDRVIQLGILSHKEKIDFFAGIDSFCLPSRSDSFGLVLLEAWANGVPLIGYRAGGIADLIRPEMDGLLVRCGDVECLGEALLRIVNDSDARAAWGESGRSRIEREFRWADKLRIVTGQCADGV